MPKRQVPAGKRGTTGQRALCQATPYWVKGPGAPPRLLCIKREGHTDKRHQDGRGHQWDVKG